jgi:hypothetical protein
MHLTEIIRYNLSPHDLRRTYAADRRPLGIRLEVIEARLTM